MNIGFVPKNEALLHNELFQFDEYDPTLPYGMDRPGFSALRERLSVSGHQVGTVDTFDPTALDCVVFIDSFAHYQEFIRQEDRPTLIYMMREPPSTVPRNGHRNLIANSPHFDYILTWNDAVADSATRFGKYSLPQYDNRESGANISGKPNESEFDGLLTNISSRKFSHHPNELYSERRSIIEYYEQKHPDAFGLYGYGWNKPPSLADIYYSRSLPRKKYRVYQGLADSKSAAYSRYQFALSFENVCGIPGYISEKLFDCLRNRIVPVYYGASNITEFVPDSAFINYQEFGNPADLHDYLNSMDTEEYREYLESGRRFFDEEIGPFSPEQFAKTVSKHITSAEQSVTVDQNASDGFSLRGEVDQYVHYESDNLADGLALLAKTVRSSSDIQTRDILKLLKSLR